MMLKKISKLLPIVALITSISSGSAQPPIPKPLNADDPKGLQLGPGVPRTVDTNGNVIGIDWDFTSKQYVQAAVKLMLPEANAVAKELQLPEELPITESNLTEAYVTPFGYHYTEKSIGRVTTKNYAYFVCQDNKFNEVDVANYGAACFDLKNQSLPVSQIDFSKPYQLATQWLAAVSMDVSRLNQDCKAHVAASPYWNGLAKLGQKPRRNFIPLYFVWWTSPKNDAEKFGDVAYVELFLPTKKLLQLNVKDSKYIMRKPLLFTNLASLFPGTARILVFTNFPVNTNIYHTVRH